MSVGILTDIVGNFEIVVILKAIQADMFSFTHWLSISV